MRYGIGETRTSTVGHMRHRITVQTATQTVDSSRQPVTTYVNRLTGEPAAFVQVSGGESVRGRQVESTVVALFKVNYRNGYSTTDRIVFDGENYGIARVEKPDGIARFLWLHCKAVT